MATVVIETNAKIQQLFNAVMGAKTKRKHFTVRNKYAVGIIHRLNEIVIYDYDRSTRYLAKVNTAGQMVVFRLGFSINDLTEVMETLQRIIAHIDAVIESQPGSKEGSEVKKTVPDYTRPSTKLDREIEIEFMIGINKDGKQIYTN